MSDDDSERARDPEARPYKGALRHLEPPERKRRRREMKEAHDDIEVEQEERRVARVRRRGRRMPLLKAAVAVAGVLPVPVAAWLGEWLGALIHLVCRYDRLRVLFHLRAAFPERSEAEIRAIARRSFRLMGRGILSLPSLRSRGAERLLERCVVEGNGYLEEALAGGRGVIVVAYHFGLFEVGGIWLAHHHRGVAVGRDVGTLDATQLLVEIRRDLGLETIERGDARAIVRALRDNRPVAIVADHDVRNLNGVFVPFFGRLAHTPAGPAALSVRTGAPIVPAVVLWEGRARYRLRPLGLLRPREDLPKDEVVPELTYRFSKLGEEAIRERPDHWLWLHKRWETRPEQRPELPVWRPAEGPDADAAD